MKRNRSGALRECSYAICWLLVVTVSCASYAQQNIIINMAPIDGMAITPDNIFNYHIQCTGSGPVQVKGSIRYRNSSMSMSYSFPYTLRQGINIINIDDIHPQWQVSSTSLQELFFTYRVLPEGTFEYCVTVTPSNTLKENKNNIFDECLYHRSEDVFLINLIYPENKAKLLEYNPMLSWVANYSFSSELTYRIRVAEMKQGQNAANAVMRNQPIYDESNLMQNSIIYPVYAKPIEPNKWYAWTVDAYYKGLLLGGAACWQFIIQDSIPPEVKTERSYIDIARETGTNHLTALGTLKLKYVLDERMNDSLYLELFNDQNQKCKLSTTSLNAKYGDNRYELDLKTGSNLKHLAPYTLIIRTKTNHEYKLPFQYINPDYTH